MNTKEWLEYYRFHPSEFESLLNYAETEILKKSERIEELEAALRPLANVGNAIDGSFYDTEKTYIWAQHDMENPIRLSIADAIRAARLLDGDK